jgi:hypothetical protein
MATVTPADLRERFFQESLAYFWKNEQGVSMDENQRKALLADYRKHYAAAFDLMDSHEDSIRHVLSVLNELADELAKMTGRCVPDEIERAVMRIAERKE